MQRNTHLRRVQLTCTAVQKALQSFYGIGPNITKQVMSRFYIHKRATIGELDSQQVLDLNAHLSTLKIENDLRRSLVDNIKRLRDMGTYRGRRHAMGLPVRGQRTRTQINTARKLNRVERKG
ncbi:putative 40s ribosomal protein s13 protein [Lasiodiplodia theobromae]|nr:putative 40s ribosomal protein s13 protein [Lasiodiplodia theobromae]